MNRKHTFIYCALRRVIALFLKLKFGYTYQIAENLPDTYIVLSNHTTDWDPLFVSSSFPKQMYFVASEHIARWKTAYKFIKFGFAPIMRYKGSVAASTIKEVFRKLKQGSNVCIFAEGVRSWDGVTGPILPSTGKMVKSARCGLVTYKITGGYFVSPGWSENGLRKGPISGAPVNIYTKEQLAKMTVEEINECINRDLYEDAYETQLASPRKYKGKQLASRLENLCFICPHCGSMDTLSSEKDTVTCSTCQKSFRYNECGMLEGIPYSTVKELVAWLKDKVNDSAVNGETYTVSNGVLKQVANHIEATVSEGTIFLSAETLSCGDYSIPIQDISDMAIHGRHALVFSTPQGYYELLPSNETSIMKFLWLYEAYKK